MVSGVSSNIIENFANFNESFHDRSNPDDKLTRDDLPACEELIDSVYGFQPEEEESNPPETTKPETTQPETTQPTTTKAPFTDVTDNVDVEEEFGDHETPVYEGFTNSDFNASSLVRGRNLHNLLKALLISLVLCSLNHKDVSRMVVEPLVSLTHNKISRTTMVCVLIFLVAYLVIALL